MNSIAATLSPASACNSAACLNEAWRCQGEYAGGCLCDGCGERIASAQASYEVDFPPGGQPACLLTYSNAGAE